MATIAKKENSIELYSIFRKIESEQDKGSIPKSGFYVYALFNTTNKEILYIGKGKGNRVKNHFKNQKARTYFEAQRLREIGQEVSFIIVKCFDNEKEAYKYESLLIQQALCQDIELINISQTHKDKYLTSTCYEGVRFLEKMLKAGYHQPPPECPEIIKCEMMNKILQALQGEAVKVPKMADKLYILGHRILDIVMFKQMPRITIIELTNGTQTEYAF